MKDRWRALDNSSNFMQPKNDPNTPSTSMALMACSTLYRPWAVQHTVRLTLHCTLSHALGPDPYWTLLLSPDQTEDSTHMWLWLHSHRCLGTVKAHVRMPYLAIPGCAQQPTQQTHGADQMLSIMTLPILSHVDPMKNTEEPQLLMARLLPTLWGPPRVIRILNISVKIPNNVL